MKGLINESLFFWREVWEEWEEWEEWEMWEERAISDWSDRSDWVTMRVCEKGCVPRIGCGAKWWELYRSNGT